MAAKARQQTLPIADFDLDTPHFGMWVGGQYYPTIKHFVDEAKNLGVSKRIPRIPDDLVLGESRIYFAHAQREERIESDVVMSKLKLSHFRRLCTICKKIVKNNITPKTLDAHPSVKKELKACVACVTKEHPDLDPGDVVKHGVDFVKAGDNNAVFGYTVISRIEFIVPQSGKVPTKIQKLADEGHVKLVPYKQAAQEPERGCGKRKAGGTYAVAYEIDEAAMQALRKDAKKVDLHGPLAVYKKPFKCWFGDKLFRGIKKLERDVVRKTEMMARLIGEKEEK
jgi:hypothetical protein